MINRDESNQVWNTISGAAPLYEIYAYWPTLHDAILTDIDIRFESKDVILTFDYNDLISSEDTEREDTATTRITLCWHGVRKADLHLCDKHVYGLSFRRIGDSIETQFDECSVGFYGSIISESIEVLAIEREGDGREFYHSDHEIRLAMGE